MKKYKSEYMKKLRTKYIVLAALMVSLIAVYSCNKFLNKPPVGSLSSSVLATKSGVDGILIGAYSMLDGYATTSTSWETSTSNWAYAGIPSDDAYKGSNTTDQPVAVPLENHSVDPSNEYLEEKWTFCYNAIQRANDVIREVPLVTDGSLTAAYAQEVIAEAKFLRGFFHLELAKLWINVPYVNETITYTAGNYNVPNPGPIWDSIAADFSAAMTVLPKGASSQPGRANYYAAEAFLAKTYMFAHNYTAALPLLTDLISNGVTTSGAKYALVPFENNFDAAYRNNAESVFCVQSTVSDGSGGNNSNEGDVLNFPGGGTYTGCCGFYQPSISLGNAYKTDANGLPMLGTTTQTVSVYASDNTTLSSVTATLPNYNLTNLGNDYGKAATDPFTPPTDALDPRIDWTLGRRGIPYLDWGLCGGYTWTRGDQTPYNPKKNVFWYGETGTYETAEGWAGNQGDAINFNLIRFADVILWRAECEVEANNLQAAENDVNTVRNRMAAHPEYWVHTYVDASNPSKGFTTTPAANYKIGLYGAAGTNPASGFAANGQMYSRLAVYMERQLELAMEGHRFFDLMRYDGRFGGPMPAGYMAGVLNNYILADTRSPIPNPVLDGHQFTAARNEIYPIPQLEIDKEGGKLVQNKGY